MRVALLGGGAQLIPSYSALLKKLSRNFEITLYSEFHLGPEWMTDEYKVKSVPSWITAWRIRTIYFGLWVLVEHVRKKFDLVHSHSTYPSGLVGVIAGKLFRIPVLVSLDAAETVAIPEIGFGDLLNSRRMKLNCFVLDRANVITVLTGYQGSFVNRNLGKDYRLKVIPRGVDLTRFTFSNREPGRQVRFLNVAYLHPVKDQITLLKCFSLLCRHLDCKLTIVGRDLSNGELKKLCLSLGLADRVRFEEHVPHSGIQEFYRSADVLLHTSLFESQGIVVAEALAEGVLVCGTHVGLMADLSDRCCVTVEPGQASALADKILKLLDNPTQMIRMKEAGRQWAEQHDLEWTARQYSETYMSLLHSMPSSKRQNES
ncbi:MAG TPA: glycosyltransferase family 4 protein [Steroidobacteraceae bacterium]|jgi:glycosyltransferase involved in cell wall biosynthesis|nr:glycosyltransferase family 4 protein [Steroidobacteraceae bacterium]